MLNLGNRAIPHPGRINTLLAGAIALFAVLVVVYSASIDIRATRGASITGDEPFYLLTTQSLIQDGNLDLRRQYRDSTYKDFFDHPEGLWLQSSSRDSGKLLSPHNPGLSVLLIPGFSLGGLLGAQIQLVIITALTFSLAYIFIARQTLSIWASWFATLLIGITATAFIYSSEIYPEIPSALTLLIALLILQRKSEIPRWQSLALVLCLTAMVWLGIKYAPLAGLVAIWGFWRMNGLPRFLFAVAAILNSGMFIWFHVETFGALTPYSVNLVYSGDGTISILGEHMEFKRRVYRPLGLLVDQRFGIARWSPILFLAIIAVPLVWRNNGISKLVLIIISIQILIATFVAITMMGWWFPGRTLVTVLPLIGLPLAILITKSGNYTRSIIATLGIYSFAVTAFLALAGHSREIVIAVDPFEMSSYVFQLIAPIMPDYRIWNTHTWTFTGVWLFLITIGTIAFNVTSRPKISS